MNRNASLTARIIGCDVSQVKQWAVLFKDHLSPRANPPKGRTREFTESDVLVLSYVFFNWEDEPDLESIRIRLNDEAQYDKRFLENLYLSTPLLQEPPDGLNETWRHGVLLCGGVMQGYLELARNYRHVAEKLLEDALVSGEPRDFAYPVLFAYRHTLELYLKIVGEIDVPTHSLEKCVRLVEKRHGQKIGSPVRGWILELDEIDPTGTAFRYADAQDGAEYWHWLDLVQFKFAMKKVFEMLDSAILRSGVNGKPARKRK